MPLLWRYLLSSFFRILSLSVCTFVFILLISRFKEIARFGALSESISKTFLFTLYQIPLILPLAIPLSVFIAALILFQRMSKSFELNAFRASGISISTILTPILLASLFLSFVNFELTAEIAPYCRRASKEIIYHETSSNPLLLLQRQNLVKGNDLYIQMNLNRNGNVAKDFFLITHSHAQDCLSLFCAKKVTIHDSSLLGHDVALITHAKSLEKGTFDPLIIENESWMKTNAAALSLPLKKYRPHHMDPASLELPLLQYHSKEKESAKNKSFVENLRRIALAASVFTFALLGCSYGIEEGRDPSKKNLIAALSLALFLLMSYFLGKEFKSIPQIAFLIFFAPHPILWSFSLRRTFFSEAL